MLFQSHFSRSPQTFADAWVVVAFPFLVLIIVIVLLRPAYPLVLFLALLLFAGNAAFVVFFPFPPL